MQEVRKKKAKKEQDEAIEAEKQRRMQQKEIQEAKLARQQQEMQELAEERRKQKIADRLAKQRILDQIKADREAKKAEQQPVEPKVSNALPKRKVHFVYSHSNKRTRQRRQRSTAMRHAYRYGSQMANRSCTHSKQANHSLACVCTRR